MARPPGIASPLPGPGPESTTVGEYLKQNRWSLLALGVLFGLVFSSTISGLVRYCLEKDDFSHCLLIPAVSGAIFFANRRSIAAYPARCSPLGLAVLLFSLALFAVGYLRTLNVLQRAGMVGCVIGLGVYLLGFEVLRRHPFPSLYLFLALPVPFTVHQQISLGLRNLATKFSAGLLRVTGVPVLDDANVLLVDGEPMKVADACSGIRSLMAITSVTVLFCYLFRTGLLGGLLLTAVAVPVALLVNVLRIFVTGFALHRFELDLREGMVHESMGLVTFCLGLVCLFLTWRFLRWLLRLKPEATLEGGAAA